MTKRNFAGRVVVLFCCLAGLTWAVCELIRSQTRVVAVSNDATMTDMRVGTILDINIIGYHRCNRKSNCPGRCRIGHCWSFPGLDPCNPATWFIVTTDYTRSGCTSTGTYKVCEPFEKCLPCADVVPKCGFEELVIWRDDGFDVENCVLLNARYDCAVILNQLCKKGCNLF